MSNTSHAVCRERHSHVEVWTLNRPELRNPISEADVVESLERFVQEANLDDDVRAIVLTGAGPAFSSGGNVKHMRDREGMFGGSPAQLRQGYRHGIQRVPLAMRSLEVPIIAAVNGPAIGAGCDLALLCDIRIAGESAKFAESFTAVGLIPGDGGAWLLPRAVGMSRAAQLIFTSQRIDAATALAWGLVSEVVADDALLPRCLELAEQIAAMPAQVTRMAKTLLHAGESQDLAQHLEVCAAMQAVAHHTDDHLEAVNAMLEKRPPRYTGR